MKRIEKLSKLPKDDKTTFEFLETNKENSKKWKPKYGEYYSYVDDKGDAYEKHWCDCPEDFYHYFTNNCFKTQDGALVRLEQIRVYNELKNFADKHNRKINWNNGEFKCFIIYDVFRKELIVSGTAVFKEIGQIYFSDVEIAEKAIEEIGEDRIKKYLFEVE